MNFGGYHITPVGNCRHLGLRCIEWDDLERSQVQDQIFDIEAYALFLGGRLKNLKMCIFGLI